MRKLFLIVVIALALASVCTVLSLRSKADRPVLVWATGICPERYEQAELFRKWLVRNGHTAPDGGPVCDIELQASDQQSSLIQAVSGMGSDLIDRIAVERFAPMGVLEDITEFARENGLNPERNYGPAAELLTCEGRQYVYPCNLACYGLLVNVDTFEKVGMAAPPEEWTPEEFERIGLEFTRRANAGKPRQEVFFCAWTPMMLQIARSRGADVFNETLTAAKLNRTEFIDAVKLQHKWTEIDHLMPTAAERRATTAAKRQQRRIAAVRVGPVRDVPDRALRKHGFAPHEAAGAPVVQPASSVRIQKYAASRPQHRNLPGDEVSGICETFPALPG